jgi:predicted ribosomally synthesized peptide with SipW-like signal peptide
MHTAESPIDRPTARSIASSAALELFWIAAGLFAVGLGFFGYHSRYMAGLAPFALGFALLARSGGLASRWPRPDAHEEIGIGRDIVGAIVAIVLGSLVLLTSLPAVLLAVAGLFLGGLSISDAYVQRESVGSRLGDEVGRAMTFTGVLAIVLSLLAFITQSTFPVLLAMSCIGIGLAAATLASFSASKNVSEEV